jgi:sensor histidine kinase YesM
MSSPDVKPLPLLPALAATVVFNALIALFLSVVGVGGADRGVWTLLHENMVWSQCIGLSMAIMVMLAIQANPPGKRRLMAIVGAVTGGTAVGVALAPLMVGLISISDDVATVHSDAPAQALFIGLFFGSIASAFFWLRERNASLAAELEVRESARIEAEKRGVEAQLKMLQAQIEPHFLFNTLANVASLIHSAPAMAGTLLDALNRYLRASLTRTREGGGTLGDEIALLRAYLEVLQIRMGARLKFEFDVAPALLQVEFPPMLLQPLVENAITHGLEPKIEGGKIRIAAMLDADNLRISVSDDGMGLAEAAPSIHRDGHGFGLDNIRARLGALYGVGARLTLSSKLGAGVTAELLVPFAGKA